MAPPPLSAAAILGMDAAGPSPWQPAAPAPVGEAGQRWRQRPAPPGSGDAEERRQGAGGKHGTARHGTAPHHGRPAPAAAQLSAGGSGSGPRLRLREQPRKVAAGWAPPIASLWAVLPQGCGARWHGLVFVSVVPRGAVP